MTHTKKIGKPYLDTDICFTDKKIFGDNEEHYYDVTCYDGYAEAKRCDYESSAHKTLKLTYPKLENVLKNKSLCDKIRDFRGLGCSDEINYGDIMIYLGKLSL